MNRTLPIFFVLITALLAGSCRSDAGNEVHIFAAASLTDVMEAFADSSASRTGSAAVINVAGSSLLARQIDRGARADLFVSAHPNWTEFLYERGRIQEPVTLPVSNTLVEVRRRELRADDRGRPQIALADPSHVPAGIYAKQALECEGRWEDVEPLVVPTLDVRAALTAVRTGAVRAAIVYASDALLTPEMDVRPAVSDSCQPSVRYTAAIVSSSDREDAAAELLSWMQSDEARETWQQHGFTFHSDR